jgi:hypothetical protein
MTLQLDDVDPAARTKRILVLTAGDGAGHSPPPAVAAAN